MTALDSHLDAAAIATAVFQPSFPGFIPERAVAQVSIENILAPLRDQQIGISVVVDVSNTNPLAPSALLDACLGGDVFKLEAAKIVIQDIARLRSVLLQSSRADQKDIRQAVVIKIEDCNSVSGRFHDVLF